MLSCKFYIRIYYMTIGRAIKIKTNQLKAYNKDILDGLDLIEDESNSLKILFTLTGPKETPWEDCIMHGYVLCPENYPFGPPSIVFSTKTNHPNIYKDGKVCLSILNNKQDETGYFQQSELWTPALDLRCIFLCIINLFNEPNLESPADLDACILYRNNIKKFTQTVRKLFEDDLENFNNKTIDINMEIKNNIINEI
jgi:ubiquitin-protein ligase